MLGNYSEITGTLTDFRYDELGLVLTFMVKMEVRLPSNIISEDELSRLKGKRIGIMNVDGKYHFRQIKDKEERWYDKYQ